MGSRGTGEPRRSLTVVDTVAVIVGVVVGAGIFRTPSLVAANVGSEGLLLLVWILGGAASLVGALCYAELATAYPDCGGDYHYLTRAFGRGVGFLFAWARMTVIQTGSIALQAFLIEDYLSELWRLGEFSSSISAAAVVALVTGWNLAGLRSGTWMQTALTVTTVVGLLLVTVAGLAMGAPAEATTAAPVAPEESPRAAVGLAMIFVLLTYGGWNEAAYLSAEVRDERRGIVKSLLWGIAIITAVYVLANLAFLRGLGPEGMARSDAVAADLLRRVAGGNGARLISTLVAVAALSTMNATTITGARTTYAMGRRFPPFAALGRWKGDTNTPSHALVVQGAIALALVVLGTMTRSGFATMVEYTAPVFWFFLFLVGLSLFILRKNKPGVERPFRVPLYPVPVLFCAVCAYMLQASVLHTGLGALVGVAVLIAGLPLLLVGRRRPAAHEVESKGGTR